MHYTFQSSVDYFIHKIVTETIQFIVNHALLIITLGLQRNMHCAHASLYNNSLKHEMNINRFKIFFKTIKGSKKRK